MLCKLNGETIKTITDLLNKGHKLQIEYDKKKQEIKILDLRLKKIKVE